MARGGARAQGPRRRERAGQGGGDMRLGVYVTDPVKRTEQVRFPGLYRVLDHTNGFDQGSLDRWLEQLAAA